MIDKQSVRIRRILTVIGTRTLTRQGIMAELDLSKDGIRNFRANYLRPAMALGFVKMTNPKCPTIPDQSYQLTQKGLEALAVNGSKEHTWS